MGDVGGFLKKKLNFLVSTPRRKFADRVGTWLGVLGFLIIFFIFIYGQFSKWGILGCGLCMLFIFPAFVFCEVIGISEGSVFGFIMYPLVSFFIYYFMGYVLGLFFYAKEDSDDKSGKKKN